MDWFSCSLNRFKWIMKIHLASFSLHLLSDISFLLACVRAFDFFIFSALPSHFIGDWLSRFRFASIYFFFVKKKDFRSDFKMKIHFFDRLSSSWRDGAACKWKCKYRFRLNSILDTTILPGNKPYWSWSYRFRCVQIIKWFVYNGCTIEWMWRFCWVSEKGASLQVTNGDNIWQTHRVHHMNVIWFGR